MGFVDNYGRNYGAAGRRVILHIYREQILLVHSPSLDTHQHPELVRYKHELSLVPLAHFAHHIFKVTKDTTATIIGM